MRPSLPYPKLTAALCGVLALFVLGAGKKISDYTETLELGDAWIYEIAVPGVTNYKVTFGTIATNIIARVPGGGGSLATNANQFGASTTLTLKNGLLVTNPVFYGSVTLPGLNITNGSVTSSNFVDMTNVKFWGAVGDGVTDDTAALQTALNRAGAIYIPAGTYRTTNTLSIKSNTKLTGDGKNSVIMLNPSAGAALIYRNGLQTEDRAFSVTIRDLTVNCKSNGNNGITLASVTGGLVDNCTVISPAGYGIWVTGTDYSATTVGNQAREVTVANCIVTNVVDVGIEFLDSVACSMIGNHVYVNSNGTGLLIWGGSSNCTMVGNTVVSLHAANTAKGISLYGSGSITNPTSDHVISANTVQGCYVGLNCVGQHATANGQYIINTTFANNIVSQGTLYGCLIDNSRNIKVVGNSLSAAVPVSVNLGAAWGSVKRIFVEGNSLESTGTNHTYIVQNIGGSFVRNKVTGIYPPSYAVYFAGNQSCDVSENQFYNLSSSDGTKAYGIFTLDSGGHGTISNRFSGNMGLDDRGNKLTALIALTQASEHNTLIGNILNSSNYPAVVDVSTGTNNTFWMNQGTNYESGVLWGKIGLGGTPLGRMHVTGSAVDTLMDSWLSDMGAAADTKHWAWQVGSAVGAGMLRLRAINDAVSDGINALEVTRSGVGSITTVFPGGNVGINTNAPGYKLEVNGTTRITGAVMLNNGSPAAGQVPTFRSDGTIYPSNVVATASGTNFPPVTTTGTNITVGTGVMKSLLMPTNASVGISFNGTEILGENVTLVVTNTSATASNITISVFQDGVAASYFDSTVASNVTGFLVVSNSSKRMEFVYNGSFWRLESTIAKEMELSVAGGLSLTTNSVTSIVTLSNSLALQQLNNVGIGTPAAGDVLSWSIPMSKWTNTVVPGGDVISNITVSATNNVLLDFAAANIFKLTLLTNWTHTFTNATSLTKKGYVYFQQDTNGNRMLNNYSVSGGLLQTNASENMQPTTNANALDLLELMPGFFTTNLIAYWPQDFQPRIKFTNSLHAFLSFIDTFNRANADPMSTTASDGHSWTSGPGALAEPRIVSSMLFGNAGQTGCRVLTPAMGGNQRASLTLLGNVGALGPMVHVQSTVDASGYFLVADDSTHLAIYKLTDTGSLATLVLFTSAATPTMIAGDTIALSINGTTLECFLNGVSYGTVVDATFSGGQPGIWMNSDTASGGPFSASEQ